MSENLYNILGINENVNETEIKKAYRSLSLKYHPDKNTGDIDAVSKFQKINVAYEILGDTQKRKEYDMKLKFGNQQIPFGNPFMNSDIPFEDILSSIFGDVSFSMHNGYSGMPLNTKVHFFNGAGPMGLHQALQKPVPITKTLNITMEQVYNGSKIPIDIERWIIENGLKVFEKEIIYIDIPKGIDDGEMIVLREKGNILDLNIKGDIKIFIKVLNESSFKREGLDLVLEKNISLKDALCGFSFEIKHLNGKSYTLHNNSGNIITPEYRKVIQQLGLIRDGHSGNLIIHFHILFPQSFTKEQIHKLTEIL
jgi:DnaJ-class molecular chaperone